MHISATGCTVNMTPLARYWGASDYLDSFEIDMIEIFSLSNPSA